MKAWSALSRIMSPCTGEIAQTRRARRSTANFSGSNFSSSWSGSCIFSVSSMRALFVRCRLKRRLRPANRGAAVYQLGRDFCTTARGRSAIPKSESIGSTDRGRIGVFCMRSHADRTMLGTGLAFLAFAVLATADAVTKFLSARYTVVEVASIDAIFALATALPELVLWEGFGSLRPQRLGIVVVRCTLGAGSL